MKSALCTIVAVLLFSSPLHSATEIPPETIAGKMALKFGRGVTNTATAIGEIPRQTVVMGRELGAAGYLVGPISGVVMTVYRAVMGVAETAFFMVPAPGYYDAMIDPPFVWEGWESKRQQPESKSEDNN